MKIEYTTLKNKICHLCDKRKDVVYEDEFGERVCKDCHTRILLEEEKKTALDRRSQELHIWWQKSVKDRCCYEYANTDNIKCGLISSRQTC